MTDHLGTAVQRFNALVILFTALKAHGDIQPAYQPYFERVLKALNRRVLQEKLNPSGGASSLTGLPPAL